MRKLLWLSLLGLLTLSPVAGQCAASGAPYTGAESAPRHAFGPDGEGKGSSEKRMPTTRMDAYGNPITGEMEAAAPRERPSAGAYGGYGAKTRPSRPLPAVEGPPKWDFR